jgi:hypothetical protein
VDIPIRLPNDHLDHNWRTSSLLLNTLEVASTLVQLEWTEVPFVVLALASLVVTLVDASRPLPKDLVYTLPRVESVALSLALPSVVA